MLLQGSHSQQLRQLRLVWVIMLCTLIMAVPSGLTQLLLPLSARELRVPDWDALLAVPPGLLGSMLLQVTDLRRLCRTYKPTACAKLCSRTAVIYASSTWLVCRAMPQAVWAGASPARACDALQLPQGALVCC